MTKALALDVGGANLKLSDGEDYSCSQSFLLWREHSRLGTALADLLVQAPAAEVLAVTMTGELADCFATKAEGVGLILNAVEQAAGGRRVFVYLCDGRLVCPQVARTEAMLAAASNWHVLASYAGRFCNGEAGLLIDIGSTTCDLIPFDCERPRAIGRNDPERLAAGELVYTGVERSPICALAQELPWRGEACAVAQEVFATTLDAYLLLSELAEDANDRETADGRSRTKHDALGRLARMICADVTMFSDADGMGMAEAVRESQLRLLLTAARRVLNRIESPPATIVISGQGEFLARHLIERLGTKGQVVSLAQELGLEASRAACAFALATLARERSGE
ncbi:MAG: hypothetical protein KDA57_06070 [Planctomycetales bacterium]|nr:hypothetical protein [Planctomycetales bacterium]